MLLCVRVCARVCARVWLRKAGYNPDFPKLCLHCSLGCIQSRKTDILGAKIPKFETDFGTDGTPAASMGVKELLKQIENGFTLMRNHLTLSYNCFCQPFC